MRIIRPCARYRRSPGAMRLRCRCVRAGRRCDRGGRSCFLRRDYPGPCPARLRRHGRAGCRRARSEDALPAIIVTARDAIEDRVRGLNAGADDYLVEPFALLELEAPIARGAASARVAGQDDICVWRAHFRCRLPGNCRLGQRAHFPSRIGAARGIVAGGRPSGRQGRARRTPLRIRRTRSTPNALEGRVSRSAQTTRRCRRRAADRDEARHRLRLWQRRSDEASFQPAPQVDHVDAVRPSPGCSCLGGRSNISGCGCTGKKSRALPSRPST